MATPVVAARRDRFASVHDWIVGALSGAGAGGIAGLFAQRLADLQLLIAVGAVLGAVAGVGLLVRDRERRGAGAAFAGPLVVSAWVVLVLSTIFIVTLANAIANFQ